MKYRQIKTNFWEDNYILDLTRDEKLLFLYLFTNPKVNMTGIYELPDRTICYTLGLTLGELAEFKTKFEKDKKYYFHKGWVFISRFTSHNIYSSAKPVIYSFIADFNIIPDEVRHYFFNTLKLPYVIPIKGSDKTMLMTSDNVMVMDKDKDKDKYGSPRVGPRVGMRLTEDIDPEEIPL